MRYEEDLKNIQSLFPLGNEYGSARTCLTKTEKEEHSDYIYIIKEGWLLKENYKDKIVCRYIYNTIQLFIL